jgi:ATP-dependent Clp protease ATP-binding subunit ClpA
MDIEPEQVAKALGQALSTSDNEAPATRFSAAAANVLELTVTEAIALGHNYVGCEHLLLGLVSEQDGTAGEVLRGQGAELRSTRRAVVAALAGYVHLRAQSGPIGPAPLDPARLVATSVRHELQPVISRLERLEHHMGLTDGN